MGLFKDFDIPNAPWRLLPPFASTASENPEGLGASLSGKQGAMAKVTASAERMIDAPAAQVYGYLADQNQHAKFLPPAFSDFQVVEGGVGAGSATRFKITAGGRTREYNMRVSEPEPGRTLVETDQGSSLRTTFTVTPQGDNSLVNITTSWDGAGGIGGFFEKTFAPRALHRLYLDELSRLNAYALAQRG
jgi:uncharacterized protein YndB with AHSA1/START domain